MAKRGGGWGLVEDCAGDSGWHKWNWIREGGERGETVGYFGLSTI